MSYILYFFMWLILRTHNYIIFIGVDYISTFCNPKRLINCFWIYFAGFYCEVIKITNIIFLLTNRYLNIHMYAQYLFGNTVFQTFRPAYLLGLFCISKNCYFIIEFIFELNKLPLFPLLMYLWSSRISSVPIL